MKKGTELFCSYLKTDAKEVYVITELVGNLNYFKYFCSLKKNWCL